MEFSFWPCLEIWFSVYHDMKVSPTFAIPTFGKIADTTFHFRLGNRLLYKELSLPLPKSRDLFRIFVLSSEILVFGEYAPEEFLCV
jgi:hypothetical protein